MNHRHITDCAPPATDLFPGSDFRRCRACEDGTDTRDRPRSLRAENLENTAVTRASYSSGPGMWVSCWWGRQGLVAGRGPGLGGGLPAHHSHHTPQKNGCGKQEWRPLSAGGDGGRERWGQTSTRGNTGTHPKTNLAQGTTWAPVGQPPLARTRRLHPHERRTCPCSLHSPRQQAGQGGRHPRCGAVEAALQILPAAALLGHW